MAEKFTTYDFTKPRGRGSALCIPGSQSNLTSPTKTHLGDDTEDGKSTSVVPMSVPLFNGDNKTFNANRTSKRNLSNLKAGGVSKTGSNGEVNKGSSNGNLAVHVNGERDGEEMSIHHDPMEGRENAINVDGLDQDESDEKQEGGGGGVDSVKVAVLDAEEQGVETTPVAKDEANGPASS
jgi:hypothetical protein